MRLQLQDHGSLWLVQPQNPESAAWLKTTAPPEAQWWGHAMAIQPRYVVDFVKIAQNAGALVEVV